MRTAVLHLLAPAPFGGLERVVEALTGGLVAQGRRIGVAALGVPSGADHPLVAGLAGRGVTVEPVVAGRRAYLRQAALVRETMVRGGYRILHSHGYHADLLAALLRTGPRVTTLHGFTGGDRRNRLYEWLERRAVRGFDRVVAVSAPLAADLIRSGVAPSRVVVIRNALPPETGALSQAEARARLGLPLVGPVVGWVGRLSVEKGPDLFLEAVRRVVGPMTAVVVGDGPLRVRLEAAAVGNAGGHPIRWVGSIPDAFRLFAAFDALVLSSRTEGTPMVLLEAMRAGVPIVATAVGGVPDVVSADEALLVPPESVALAAAMERVLGAGAEARDRALRAQARAARDLDYQNWLDRYQAIYRELEGAR